MVTLDTFRALHEHDHQLAAYCPTPTWAVLDLEQLIAEGRGDDCFVGRQPRCRLLPAGAGTWQLRPPAMPSGDRGVAPTSDNQLRVLFAVPFTIPQIKAVHLGAISLGGTSSPRKLPNRLGLPA